VISTLLSTIVAAESSGGGSLTGLLIILVPMGAILYMTIIPQRKQKQKQAALLSKLDVGDEVITTGGIIGIITFVEDDLYHIEVDNDVVIRIAKSAVARGLAEPDEPAKSASRSRKGLLSGALGGQTNAKDDGDDDGSDDAASESDTGSTVVDKK
jgi:preprotein translocase subunit YajC